MLEHPRNATFRSKVSVNKENLIKKSYSHVEGVKLDFTWLRMQLICSIVTILRFENQRWRCLVDDSTQLRTNQHADGKILNHIACARGGVKDKRFEAKVKAKDIKKSEAKDSPTEDRNARGQGPRTQAQVLYKNNT